MIKFIISLDGYDIVKDNGPYKFDEKIGELHYSKEQRAWVCWTGAGYSDNNKQSTQGVTYYDSLKDTEEQIIQDFTDFKEEQKQQQYY